MKGNNRVSGIHLIAALAVLAVAAGLLWADDGGRPSGGALAMGVISGTPTPTPTPDPTPTPTPTPTPAPTPTPTHAPTPAPTATRTPTPAPTMTPSPAPTPTATPAPTPSPTPEPTPDGMLWGDDDCNTSVDPVDALGVLRNVARLSAVQQTEPCPDVGSGIQVGSGSAGVQDWGDIDCDANITPVDALWILKHVAHLPIPDHGACPDVGDSVQVFVPQ